MKIEKRVEAFKKEYSKLVEKYKVDLKAVIDIKQTGIVPVMIIIDKEPKPKSNIITPK